MAAQIQACHHQKMAYIYLRQSTLVQVREHTESTMRQYALADTAVALGWAPRDVEVIDRDLGLSGTSAAHRQGFRDLMSRVCLGEVGAVPGLEVSRLARAPDPRAGCRPGLIGHPDDHPPGFPAVGGRCVPAKGRRGLCPGGLAAVALLQRLAPVAGAVCPDRHLAH